MSEVYDPREQEDVIQTFADMLRAATGDGGKKRAAGLKPSWKVDPSHEAAMWSHINKWKHGEKRDADSKAHPLVHLAWRALAIAWQESETVDGTTEEILSVYQPPSSEIERHLAKNCTICAMLGIRNNEQRRIHG